MTQHIHRTFVHPSGLVCPHLGPKGDFHCIAEPLNTNKDALPALDAKSYVLGRKSTTVLELAEVMKCLHSSKRVDVVSFTKQTSNQLP